MIFDLRWETVTGLYAVHYLARRQKPVPAAEIARFGHLAAANLAKVLQRLRRAGLVRSGRGQGFALARPAAAISAFDVVVALEGPPAMAGRCLMKNETCEFQEVCPMSQVCRGVTASLIAALQAITFDQLPVGATGLPVCMDRRGGFPTPTRPDGETKERT